MEYICLKECIIMKKYDGLSIEKSYSESLRQRGQRQYLQPWLHQLLFLLVLLGFKISARYDYFRIYVYI